MRTGNAGLVGEMLGERETECEGRVRWFLGRRVGGHRVFGTITVMLDLTYMEIEGIGQAVWQEFLHRL
jgi:hypothetical protein